MASNKPVTPRYKFDRSTYVKFLERSDFKLAKYYDISLEGFSCFANKPVDIGEKMKVEVNLKMISGGLIDDMDPHYVMSEVIGKEKVGEKNIYRFKFIEFSENTFDNLTKAIDYLDQKEKLAAFSNISTDNLEAQDTITEIVKGMADSIKKGKISLPVLPKIVQEIEEVTKNPDASTDDIAEVIEKDAVISVKIIATANSPFYRGLNQSVTVRETIPRLGIKETQNLVLTIATKSLYNAKSEQFVQLLEKLWSHSLACALNAKAIAQELKLKNADQYFTLGLIHDIGQTVLLKILGEMTATKTFDTNDIIDTTNEHAVELSEIILKHWDFSAGFINAVIKHTNNNFDKKTSRATLVINVANYMSYNIGFGFGIKEGEVYLPNLESVKLLGIVPDRLDEINEQTRTSIENSGGAF